MSPLFSLRFGFLAAVAVVAAICGLPAKAQYVAATITAGTLPHAVAVNPVTNNIYVANSGSSSVTVINGATNATSTVPAGTTPDDIAINPVTNMIYVVNRDGGNLTVINGTTNATSTVGTGTTPIAVAVNPVTDKIYVANSGSSSVTVIDGATNATSTITAGTSPGAIAVNPVTNKIYVANSGSASVTVIDGATNTAVTVATGGLPISIAVDPVTDKIYVANNSASSVTVIDGATNSTSTIATGTLPSSVAVDPVTDKIYVADNGSSSVTIIDGATNTTSTVAVGGSTKNVAVDSVTDEIYVATGAGAFPGSVVVIDGATQATTTVNAGAGTYAIAVNPVTDKVYATNYNAGTVTVVDGPTNVIATVAVGTSPDAVVVNPVTNKIYVANNGSSSVTVIDGATNSTTTVTVGTSPMAIAVNPMTSKIYVANSGSANVTVIDGATNTTATVAAGANPTAVAINPATNKIYVVSRADSNVTVIDGATDATSTIAVGEEPTDIAIDSATNKIYVACFEGGSLGLGGVTVIDGATNVATEVTAGTEPIQIFEPGHIAVNPVTNTIYTTFASGGSGPGGMTVINGATNTITAGIGGPGPGPIAVDTLTNKIYVSAAFNLCMVDGVTNSVTTFPLIGNGEVSAAVNPATGKIYMAGGSGVGVIDASSSVLGSVATGTNAIAVAVNPVTNKIYVANNGSSNVAVLADQQGLTVPLTASITPLQGNQTTSLTPAFTFNTQSLFSPIAPAPQNVFFQMDTWRGPWTQATNNGPSFGGAVTSLPVGFHILYAYTDDGQDATSVQADSPLVGAIAAYGFVVAALITPPSFTLAASPSTATVATGRSVVFNAIATGYPAPTYQWTLNGSTTIPGASVTNDPILVITGATSADVGAITCTATNSDGTATSSATLAVSSTSSPGYLTNLSGRGVVGSGAANALFGGFGTSGSGTKNLLIRGMGPSLTLVNIPAGTELLSTQLTLYDHLSAVITQNTDWAGNATITAVENQVGAYLVPANSLDSMLYVQEPVNAYSASVGGVGGDTGIAVVELYDADTPPLASRLVNLAVRAPVGTGNNILFGGFSIGGATDDAILIRAIGPSLAFPPSSLTGYLVQPVLTIYQDGNPTPLYSNTVWGGDQALVNAEGVVGAYPISTSSQDSLLLISLPTGNYTAEITGVNYTTGIAVVEIYEVP